MADRRADALLFGCDFQTNAAIVLMLENIKDLSSLRLEGNYEDIALTLNDGSKILAQAKSVQESSSDFRNVRATLKKALTTLSEVDSPDVKKLILVTNSPNPLNDDASRSVFYGHAHRNYNSLPESAKNIIDGYLSQINQPLDKNKFNIHVIPFETDDEKERYKVINQVINDFVGDISPSLSPGIGKKLFAIWKNDVFTNSSKKDASIEISKKSIIWPIIVIETDINTTDDSFRERFDNGVLDEVVRVYHAIIDNCCEKIEFVTKVIFDYNQFSSSKKPIDKCLDFVESEWATYKSEFETQGMDSDVLEALTKIVLYNVIKRRFTINQIKQGVNL